MSTRVLIVDDSMYMRTNINETLSNAGYEVIGMADSGESAIDMAMALKPDLITLDNILPDMIGTDVLRVLKQEVKLESTIIMISAVGQDSVIQEGMSLGAADYIVKPFTSESLVAAINKVMGK